MPLETELARLTAGWPRAPLLDPSALDEAAETLGIRWPDDYRALISEHDGVEGTIGPWYVAMTAADSLVDDNRSDDDGAPGVVFIGSDGGEERIAYDRTTLELLLIRSDDDGSQWINLGPNLAEAFAHFERDDVFDNPRHHEPVQSPPAVWPPDWREKIAAQLRET